MKRLALFTLLFAIAAYAVWFSAAGIFTQQEIRWHNIVANDAATINARYHISDQPAVLYLEWGEAPYYFSTNSSCRYASPEVLANDRDDWDISYLPQYQEEYACVAAYQGKYIIMEHDDPTDDWFGENQTVRQPLMSIIKNNYSVVYHGIWRVWERK